MNVLCRGSCDSVWIRTTCLVVTALVMAGCQNSTTRPAAQKATVAPTVTVPVTAVPAAAIPNATAPAVSIRTPISDQPSFTLARVVSGIRRGTAIATLPKRFGGLCNASYGRKATLDWASGTREFGNWRSEFGQLFFEALRDGGVNVVGDPQDLFGQKKNAQSAEFLVGARIQKLTGKFCERHRWFGRSSTGRFNGEFTIDVEWSVYSTLSKKTVVRFNTQGYFKQRKAKANGVFITFLGAFAAATEDLLKTQQFVDLVERRSESVDAPTRAVSPARTMPEGGGEFTPIEIARFRQSKLPIRRIVADVTGAVVSIRAGGGLGSGFLVDGSGLLLTNEHVVRSARRVQVVFGNGLEVTGTVVRRDPVHDVALVKVPLRARNVLPIRMKPAERLEDVYAVGSPLMEELAGTVTRGIVSAWRRLKRDGRRLIQADVPITGGNSGGPLLDQSGNVIGISVAGFTVEDAQNLNLFIPINDALEALNIVYSNKRTAGG
ncbi:MAG: serine protease Do [Paracoccaceae bacterium]|jgi:serine protease Do